MVIEATAISPESIAAQTAHMDAYDHPHEREALEHLWIHSANYIELAEKRGLRVFASGNGCTLTDVHVMSGWTASRGCGW